MNEEQTVANDNSVIVETDVKAETVEVKKDNFINKEALEGAVISSAYVTERKAPVFFSEENQKVKIEVDVLSDPSSGKILSVFKKGSFPTVDIEKYLVKTEQWFDFTVPSYEDVSFYRQKSSKYPNKETVVDVNAFRNFIIARHLKEWSLTDKDGNIIVLETDIDDTLSKESVRFVNKVPTVIWDVVLTAFEKETLIM